MSVHRNRGKEIRAIELAEEASADMHGQDPNVLTTRASKALRDDYDREEVLSAGARFIVPLCGSMMLIPACLVDDRGHIDYTDEGASSGLVDRASTARDSMLGLEFRSD